MSELITGIRRTATPPRSSGVTSAKTVGVNTGDPSLKRNDDTVENATARGFPSSIGAGHKSNGWHELTDVEMRAYTETAVAYSLTAGQSITLDPTRVQIYYIDVTGSCTINVVPVTFDDPAVPRQDATNRKRTYSCVLRLKVPSGNAFPTIAGARWSEGASTPNVLKNDGTTPTDYGGRYTFTFLYDPIFNDILGHEGGIRF